MNLRAIISFPVAHLSYGIGHGCCLIIERFDWCAPVLFGPYQWFMTRSYLLEKWADTEFVWKAKESK
jgi:hypothetical protein